MKPHLVSLRGILCAIALTACASGAPLARLRVQPLPEAAAPAARELSQRAAGLALAGNDQSAKALYQQATQGALDSDVAHLNLGRLHLNLEEVDEAQQAFEKAKALNDENLAADDHRKLLNHYRHRLLFPKPFLGAEDVVSSLSGTHRTTLFNNDAGTFVSHRAIVNAHFLGVEMPLQRHSHQAVTPTPSLAIYRSNCAAFRARWRRRITPSRSAPPWFLVPAAKPMAWGTAT